EAALALENARLYEEAERRRREAEVVAEISRTINASLDVDTVLQQVVEGARILCQSDGARIALREPETGSYTFRYWVDPNQEGYAGVRVETGPGSLGDRVRQSRRPVRTTAAETSGEGFRAQMAVPIVIGNEIEGLLFVDNRSPRPFTDLDESALVLLAEHAAVALRNARLFMEAQATGRRLQAVSRRLLEVQEAERRHLSRELHDEVGQALTAVKMNLQMLRRQSAPPQATGRLDESIGLVDRILQGVRQLSLDLRPSLLDDLGLAAALRWYVSAQAERSGIAANVVTEPLPDHLPIATSTTCFRVAQEAVTNALRHAKATRITVTLRCEGKELRGAGGRERRGWRGRGRPPAGHAGSRRWAARARGACAAGGRPLQHCFGAGVGDHPPCLAAPVHAVTVQHAGRCGRNPMNTPTITETDTERVEPTAPLRVVIADDHALVRAGLRSLLGGIPAIQVVPQAHAR